MFLTSCNETINFVLSTFLLAPVFQRNGVPVSMGPSGYRNDDMSFLKRMATTELGNSSSGPRCSSAAWKRGSILQTLFEAVGDPECMSVRKLTRNESSHLTNNSVYPKAR